MEDDRLQFRTNAMQFGTTTYFQIGIKGSYTLHHYTQSIQKHIDIFQGLIQHIEVRKTDE